MNITLTESEAKAIIMGHYGLVPSDTITILGTSKAVSYDKDIPENWECPDYIKDLVKCGNVVGAVKEIRRLTLCSFITAKYYFDSHLDHLRPSR